MNMFQKKSRILAYMMLFFGIGFFLFALTHPTASFPWRIEITYFIYIVYILSMVVLFIASHQKK